MADVLTAPVPARWGAWQRVKNSVLYIVIRTVFGLVGCVPLAAKLAVAPVLGAVAFVVAGRERRRALANTALAFPEWSDGQRRRMVRACFGHLATAAIEATAMEQVLAGVTLSASDRALMDRLLAQGRGVVAVSGHIGHWELLAQLMARSGYDVTTIAKYAYDPRLTRWIHALRTASGLKVLWRKDAGLAKEMLRVFHRGGILAMLIDQATRVQGAFVPFFGQPAHTPTAAAALALRASAPVLIAWTQRENGAHKVYLRELVFTPGGNFETDTVALTAAMNAALEAAIRQAPEQWVWMHHRWKQTPPTLA